MRDEVFANEKSKKIVTYAKFEIEINEDLDTLVDNLFQQAVSLLKNTELNNEYKKTNLKEICLPVLCKISKKMEASSQIMRREINPDKWTMIWFLISEVILFCIYRYQIKGGIKKKSKIISLMIRGFIEFYKKIFSVTYEEAVFIIDVL